MEEINFYLLTFIILLAFVIAIYTINTYKHGNLTFLDNLLSNDNKSNHTNIQETNSMISTMTCDKDKCSINIKTDPSVNKNIQSLNVEIPNPKNIQSQQLIHSQQPTHSCQHDDHHSTNQIAAIDNNLTINNDNNFIINADNNNVDNGSFVNVANQINNSSLIEHRDRRVLYDQLYPPLNREDKYNTLDLLYNIDRQFFNVSTNSLHDTFRPIGYLSDDTNINNPKLILFGRQLYKNGRSEFYTSPADLSLSSIKIPLDSKILNNMYDIPDKIQLTSIYPGNYTVTTMQNPNLYNTYY